MKNLSAMLLFVSVLLFAAENAFGQDLPSFRKKAEETVKTKNAAWKLIRKQEREKEVTYLWGRDDNADVVLTIFYGNSEQEAADRMKATLNRLSVGPGKKRADIGDEAYSWKSEPRGSGGIRSLAQEIQKQ